MQKKIDELTNEVNNQMERILIEKKVGLFQRVGTVVDKGVEKTREVIEEAHRDGRCRIM